MKSLRLLRTLFFVSLTSLFYSCKDGGLFGNKKDDWPCDEGDTKTMQFVQYGTLAPIEGATVYLFSYENNSDTPSNIEIKTSDANGNVEWPCELAVSGYCAEADGCWDDCGYGYSMNKTWVADGIYELLPKAWVKVTVIDDVPLNPEHHVLVEPIRGYANGEVMVSGFTEVIECVGNRNDFLYFFVCEWTGQANEVSIIYTDSLDVLVSPLDTLEYTYHY
jgi:hypothetical protein